MVKGFRYKLYSTVLDKEQKEKEEKVTFPVFCGRKNKQQVDWCISSLQGERRTKRWWRPVARSHTPWCAPPSQGAFLLRTWNVTLFAKLKAEDELNAAEGFERIFPTSETYFYFEYFADVNEAVPYSERLMDAYETKFGNDRAAGRQLLESYCQRGAHLLWLLSLDSVVHMIKGICILPSIFIEAIYNTLPRYKPFGSFMSFWTNCVTPNSWWSRVKGGYKGPWECSTPSEDELQPSWLPMTTRQSTKMISTQNWCISAAPTISASIQSFFWLFQVCFLIPNHLM